jgi:timeless
LFLQQKHLLNIDAHVVLQGKSGSAETKNYEEKGYNDTLFQGLICGPIASTMNEAMFHVVVSKWYISFETLKETHDLKTLTAAGALVKEMVILNTMPYSC